MLEELINHFKYYGVVGEEKLCITASLASLNGMSVGIEGNSGSGKTVIAHALIKLLDRVKTVDLSSQKSFLYEDFSNTNYLFLPELQKSLTGNPYLREALKHITEGRPAKYSVIKGGNVEEIIIPPIPIIYTLASENKFKVDVELGRRVLQLETDNSKEQQQRVKKHKAKCRHDEQVIGKPYKVVQDFSLKTHDPLAEELVKDEDIPLKDLNHYYSLVDASAHFHNRPLTKDNKRMVFVEDHKLVRNLLSIDNNIDWPRIFGIAGLQFKDDNFYEWFNNQAGKVYQQN